MPMCIFELLALDMASDTLESYKLCLKITMQHGN